MLGGAVAVATYMRMRAIVSMVVQVPVAVVVPMCFFQLGTSWANAYARLAGGRRSSFTFVELTVVLLAAVALQHDRTFGLVPENRIFLPASRPRVANPRTPNGNPESREMAEPCSRVQTV